MILNGGILGQQVSQPNGFAQFSTEAKPVLKKEQTAPVKKAGAAEGQVPDAKIMATLAKYLWMKDNPEFRLRVVTALGLLIGAKVTIRINHTLYFYLSSIYYEYNLLCPLVGCLQVINVQVPFLFKLAVDWLSTITGNAGALAEFTAANSTLLAIFVSPVAVLIGYGIARSGAAAFNGSWL